MKKSVVKALVLILSIALALVACSTNKPLTPNNITNNNMEVNKMNQTPTTNPTPTTKPLAENTNKLPQIKLIENKKMTLPTSEQMSKVASNDSLNRFAIVDDQENYPMGLEVSKRYMVLSKLASDNSPWDPAVHYTATYSLSPDYLDPQTVPNDYKGNTVHMAQVDTSQRIRLRVELFQGAEITKLSLNPSRYTEVRESSQNGVDWIEFEVDPFELTKHILVEINAAETNSYNNGLILFVNPISKIPEGNVLVLPSGIVGSDYSEMNDINALIIESNSPYDALYIPSNTIVDGRIEIKKSGFTVAGRGMVLGSRWPYAKGKSDWATSYPKEISPNGSIIKGIVSSTNGASEVTYEGITTIHPYHFNYVGAKNNINIKAFGWRYSSDGIHGEIIKGCFTRVNDDANYFNHGVIENCSYWALNNGSIFQLGWGQAAANGGGGTRISSCNILRGEWKADGGKQNNGLFTSTLNNTTGTIKDIIIDDIIVDGAIFRLIAFDNANHRGLLEDFTFKNVWIEKPFHYLGGISNMIVCGGGIKNFVFENLVVDSKKIMSLDELQPFITKEEANIIFK